MARRLTLIVLALVALTLPGSLPVVESGTGPFFSFSEPRSADLAMGIAVPLEESANFVRVSGGAEPSILVSKDGSTIWVGDTSGLMRSVNGGVSWQRMPDPFVPSIVTDGWALAEDDAGRFYVSTTIGPTSPVAISTTRGASWDFTSHVVGVEGISDRPWLVAHGDGQVHLLVNGFPRGEVCYGSSDAGLTWTSVSVVNTGGAIGGAAVEDSRGRIWYTDGNSLWRWSNPCMNAPLPIPLPPSGAAIMSPTDIDEQDRPYVVQPSAGNGAMLLHAYTPGQGFRTLSVSDPSLRSNTFPALSVLDSGEIAVAWYGSTTPGDPSVATFSGEWHVYVARVEGFWTAQPTITTTRITAVPNHVGGFCMGGVTCTSDRDLLDYFMIDMDATGTIHVAYGHDGATSTSEVRYARVS